MNIAGSARQVAEISPVAIYGAVLSTILMLVKFWELWRSRSRIEIDYEFTSLPDIGNTVIIRNLSAIPMTIRYWELQWRRCRWCSPKPEHSVTPEEFGDIVIGSHASTRLVFSYMNYFSSSPNALGKNRIYIRLNIAGRSRPVLKKVYSH